MYLKLILMNINQCPYGSSTYPWSLDRSNRFRICQLFMNKQAIIQKNFRVYIIAPTFYFLSDYNHIRRVLDRPQRVLRHILLFALKTDQNIHKACRSL